MNAAAPEVFARLGVVVDPTPAGPRPVGRRPADRRDRQGDLLRRPGHRDGRADGGAHRRSRSTGCSTSCARCAPRARPCCSSRTGSRRSSRLCQRVTIMRDGRFVRTDPIADLDHRRHHPLDGRPRPRRAVPQDRDGARARSCSRSSRLTREGVFNDVSFTGPARRDRRAGRAGRRRTQRGRPGDLRHRPPRRRHGRGRRQSRCRTARRARRWAPASRFVPEDRRQQGLVMDMAHRPQRGPRLAWRRLQHVRADPARHRARRSPPTGPAACSSSTAGSRTRCRRCPAATSRRSCSAKWLARKPQAADHRRAHPRHRRRHQGRGAPAARRARRPRASAC